MSRAFVAVLIVLSVVGTAIVANGLAAIDEDPPAKYGRALTEHRIGVP